MNIPAIEHPNYQVPLSFLYMKGKRMLFEYSPQNRGPPLTTGYYSQQLDPMHSDVPLALEPLLPLPFWLRPLENILESPLIIFVPHAEAILSSHHIFQSTALPPMKSFC